MTEVALDLVSNETLRLLASHRSDRAFTDEPVDDAELAAIVEAGYRAPTSINSQHVSVIVVRDKAKRARIAEYAGGQPWIAKAPVFILIAIDFNKTQAAARLAGTSQVIHESLEGIMAASVDSGIALYAMMVAARSLGLGAVAIGGIRKTPQGMVDLLKLPPLTFPLVGLTLGHVEKPATQKPRLPLSTFRHDEAYSDAGLDAAITAYDRTLVDYWGSLGRADGLPWSKNTAGAYQKVYHPETRPVAAKQGLIDKK